MATEKRRSFMAYISTRFARTKQFDLDTSDFVIVDGVKYKDIF